MISSLNLKINNHRLLNMKDEGMWNLILKLKIEGKKQRKGKLLWKSSENLELTGRWQES